MATPAVMTCLAAPAVMTCLAAPAVMKCVAAPAVMKCVATPSVMTCVAAPSVMTWVDEVGAAYTSALVSALGTLSLEGKGGTARSLVLTGTRVQYFHSTV